MSKYDLPKLTPQQKDFVISYYATGKNANKAYTIAYNCENMSPESIRVEASRLLNNPKIKAWIDYSEKEQNQAIKLKIEYDKTKAFEEYENIYKKALKSYGRDGNPLFSTALKAIDGKCKVVGIYEEEKQNETTIINVIRPER